MKNLLTLITALLAGWILVGSYASAQADVVCTPIGGVIVENFNEDFLFSEGPLVLGVISGDLNGGTFFVWPPAGEDAPAEGVITLETGDILRVQSQFTGSEPVGSGFHHRTEQVTILFGTGAYQRASGSFEMHGSLRGLPMAELVMRYRGEICTPAR